MRRWLCCTCQVEESYQPNENEHLKSPRNNADGKSFLCLSICLAANRMKFTSYYFVLIPKRFPYWYSHLDFGYIKGMKSLLASLSAVFLLNLK